MSYGHGLLIIFCACGVCVWIVVVGVPQQPTANHAAVFGFLVFSISGE